MTELIKFINTFLIGESSWPFRDVVFLIMLVSNVWLAVRLGRNHLKHMEAEVISNRKLIEKNNARTVAALADMVERLARIEGRLENLDRR